VTARGDGALRRANVGSRAVAGTTDLAGLRIDLAEVSRVDRALTIVAVASRSVDLEVGDPRAARSGSIGARRRRATTAHPSPTTSPATSCTAG
jgi:hypothetical protein